MNTTGRYFMCCEHCVDDPVYHRDEPANSHTVNCGYLRACPAGDRITPYDPYDPPTGQDGS